VHENPTTCRVLKLVSAFMNVNGRDRVLNPGPLSRRPDKSTTTPRSDTFKLYESLSSWFEKDLEIRYDSKKKLSGIKKKNPKKNLVSVFIHLASFYRNVTDIWSSSPHANISLKGLILFKKIHFLMFGFDALIRLCQNVCVYQYIFDLIDNGVYVVYALYSRAEESCQSIFLNHNF
jgi:hypothetical protein